MIIKMLLEDLIKELKRFDDKDIIIELSGIIETNIELKQTEIDEKDKYLIIKEKQDKKIHLNKYGRMRELMGDAGLKEPKFQYDEFFEASFLRLSYYDKNYGTYDLSNKNQKKFNNNEFPLSKIQQEIINIIIEQPNITQSDIAKKLKVSRQSIATNIKELKDNNVLERVGANKKGYWKILLDL